MATGTGCLMASATVLRADPAPSGMRALQRLLRRRWKAAMAASRGLATRLTVVMVETGAAVADADAMAAVGGIDVLLIGTNDLCASMGIPGRFGDDRVVAAYDAVVSAARNNGKSAGMGGIYDETLARRYIGMGARFVLGGNDLPLFIGAAKARSAFLRGLV